MTCFKKTSFIFAMIAVFLLNQFSYCLVKAYDLSSENYQSINLTSTIPTSTASASPTATHTPVPTIFPVFNDLDKNNWAYQSVYSLISKNRFKTYFGNRFQPKATLNREQFAKILVTGMNLTVDPFESDFIDVSVNRFSFKYIDAAKKYLPGVWKTKKIDGKYKALLYFCPTKKLTISDAISAVNKLLGYKATKIQLAKINSIISKSATFSERNAFAVALSKGFLPPTHKKCILSGLVTKADVCYILDGALKNIPSLNARYSGFFPIGASLKPTDISIPSRRAFVTKMFGSITCENAMKQNAIWKADGSYDFSAADKMIDYALSKGLKTRGHTLLWHTGVSDNMVGDGKGGLASKEVVLERIRTYVTDVVTHFKGRLYSWDVVNEVIGEEHDKNKFYQIFGTDYSYIAEAFKAARAADPGCKLFYNDFNIEGGGKYQKVYDALKQLKKQGVPIDGIGMQCHFNLNGLDINVFRNAITAFGKLGLEVHITELDVSLYSSSDGTKEFKTPPKDKVLTQAYFYQQLFQLFKSQKKYIKNVTFWNVDEGTSWLPTKWGYGKPDWPLLFDKYLLPKSAYWEVLKAS